MTTDIQQDLVTLSNKTSAMKGPGKSPWSQSCVFTLVLCSLSATSSPLFLNLMMQVRLHAHSNFIKNTFSKLIL